MLKIMAISLFCLLTFVLFGLGLSVPFHPDTSIYYVLLVLSTIVIYFFYQILGCPFCLFVSVVPILMLYLCIKGVFWLVNDEIGTMSRVC